MLEKRIDQDLKKALLSGDHLVVETLRGLKSALLYFKVEKGKRDTGLSEQEEVSVLQKEAKKRIDSADLYLKGGREDKAKTELEEKKVIEQYLPETMNDDELILIVDKTIRELSASDIKMMGKVMASVKEQTASRADGARIADLVKERLS